LASKRSDPRKLAKSLKTIYTFFMFRKLLSIYIILCFIFTNSTSALPAYADGFVLPKPGTMLLLSPSFKPAVLKGIKVFAKDPFKFDFILDQGDSAQSDRQLKDESLKLIKYFLASLTVPQGELWVNLSPYEKDRIVPDAFGQTPMGRDLLGQDYILKQITASLIYPESKSGKEFWARVYAQAQKQFGTTDVQVNTFNKVWIVPSKAEVWEGPVVNGQATAYVTDAKFKVMLEQDYLSLENHMGIAHHPADIATQVNQLGSRVVREVVIPLLEKEVNEGSNFTQLRQIYYSLILATWYKKKIKDSIIARQYVDRKKTGAIDINDPTAIEGIYHQYLQAFKKGVYNYIKEDPDPTTGQNIPRKYFSGGIGLDETPYEISHGAFPVAPRKARSLHVEFSNGGHSSAAMTTAHILGDRARQALSEAHFNADLIWRKWRENSVYFDDSDEIQGRLRVLSSSSDMVLPETELFSDRQRDQIYAILQDLLTTSDLNALAADVNAVTSEAQGREVHFFDDPEAVATATVPEKDKKWNEVLTKLKEKEWRATVRNTVHINFSGIMSGFDIIAQRKSRFALIAADQRVRKAITDSILDPRILHIEGDHRREFVNILMNKLGETGVFDMFSTLQAQELHDRLMYMISNGQSSWLSGLDGFMYVQEMFESRRIVFLNLNPGEPDKFEAIAKWEKNHDLSLDTIYTQTLIPVEMSDIVGTPRTVLISPNRSSSERISFLNLRLRQIVHDLRMSMGFFSYLGELLENLPAIDAGVREHIEKLKGDLTKKIDTIEEYRAYVIESIPNLNLLRHAILGLESYRKSDYVGFLCSEILKALDPESNFMKKVLRLSNEVYGSEDHDVTRFELEPLLQDIAIEAKKSVESDPNLKIPKVEARIDVDVEKGIELNGDSAKLGLAFMNLVRNAIFHGVSEKGKDGLVSIKASQDQGWVTITVADNGNGIAIQDLPQIFDLQFTTKEGSGGNGLGLSNVLQTIDAHGGTISVASGGLQFYEARTLIRDDHVHEGTVFTVRIPRIFELEHSNTNLAVQGKASLKGVIPGKTTPPSNSLKNIPSESIKMATFTQFAALTQEEQENLVVELRRILDREDSTAVFSFDSWPDEEIGAFRKELQRGMADLGDGVSVKVERFDNSTSRYGLLLHIHKAGEGTTSAAMSTKMQKSSDGGIDLNSVERQLNVTGRGTLHFDAAMNSVSINGLTPIITGMEPLGSFTQFMGVSAARVHK